MRLLALVMILAGAAGCASADAHAAARNDDEGVVSVRLAPVTRGAIARPVRGTGVLRLKREMDLSFKVGGVVANVLVDEGATVKKGQLLARLDPTEVDAALRQAKEASVKAERDLERVRKLHATGALPTVELQNAETGFALAVAGNDAAAFNAQRSAIVAPDDGRIDKRLVESGEVVGPGRPVFHMSGRSKGAVVRIGVTDRDVLRIHEGDVAKITLDAQPGTPIDARVSQVATVATPGAGTFDVELKVDATDLAVLSGLTAKVDIALTDANVGPQVPIGAAVFGTGGVTSIATVSADGRAHFRKVKLAYVEGDRAVLAADEHGLDDTSQVIEAGIAQIIENSRVRVVP